VSAAVAETAHREDWPRTVAEFQAWHARQPERWEYIDGQPRLMVPASMKHWIIKANTFGTLRGALARAPCTALVDGPQILTDEISAIPDVVVTCTAIDLSTPVIAEPVIIVEVMSPSSEADDAGRSGSAIARSRASNTISCCRRTNGWRRCTAPRSTSGASASSVPA
jgi:Putative restriction endonuclease